MDTRTTDFHFFLRSLHQRFTDVAIFNSDFKCLNVATASISNSIGLMSGLKTLKNFFPWNETLVVIHNDPLLGCSRSDRLHFLFSSENFHFCIEESFNLPWDFSQRVIKIPPIPIVENHRTNLPLLETLTQQPDCPKAVQQVILSTLKKIEAFQEDFRTLIKGNRNFSNKELHKQYLQACSESSLSLIKSKTYFSSQVEYDFENSAYLKLKVSTSESGVKIDFQGTTSNPSIQISDVITDSICFSFFSDYFRFSDLMNDSTYSLFQIAKPIQSFINSKSFSNKLYGEFCGPDLLCQALLDTLAEQISQKPYLAIKPHLQLTNSRQETVSWSFSNSKPMASLGTLYAYEPLLSTRPTPGGDRVPDFSLFRKMGVEVIGCQQNFRPGKSKETNDFQTSIHLQCTQATQFSFMNPMPLRKGRGSKIKSTIVRPELKINGQVPSDLFATLTLKTDDMVEFKTGLVDFP